MEMTIQGDGIRWLVTDKIGGILYGGSEEFTPWLSLEHQNFLTSQSSSSISSLLFTGAFIFGITTASAISIYRQAASKVGHLTASLPTTVLICMRKRSLGFDTDLQSQRYQHESSPGCRCDC